MGKGGSWQLYFAEWWLSGVEATVRLHDEAIGNESKNRTLCHEASLGMASLPCHTLRLTRDKSRPSVSVLNPNK
jgi:hypothetical protein